MPQGLFDDESAALAANATLQSAIEAYAQAEALFNSIGDGAIATDELGRITKINQAALDILGYKESQMIGAWFPKAVASYYENGQPISLMDRPIARAFLTGKPITERSLYKVKDGSLLPVSSTVAPLIMGNRPIGAVTIFRDISVEYEIDRMKSDFISLASHQLRTPLSAIKTYSHMLIDGFMGPLTATQKKSLRTIVSASNRMNELISTLLNVSRIESGNVVISPKNVNLNHIADEVFRELSLTANTKSTQLISKLPKQPVIIKADNLLTKEIIVNLVSNAVKYTPEQGEVTLTIKRQGSQALISVKDNGMGIPKSAQNKIFTKFYRAHNVVRQETSGTGLGLYLVKGLVEALGGAIWFESTEHVGTTFFVKLPLEYSGQNRFESAEAAPAKRKPTNHKKV